MSIRYLVPPGPHYYQELYWPTKFDRLYLMNVRILTSEDGGKTFNQLQEIDKHSDNDSIAFRENDPIIFLLEQMLVFTSQF